MVIRKFNQLGHSAMRIGIFGGTFDPPHLGHLILASESYYQCRLDRLLWLLTPYPPHKPNQPITPLENRLEMVQACIADVREFELSTIDIDRPPPHYAVDTVRILQEQNPGSEMIYLMGSDSLLNLHTWHRPMAFVQACHSIAVTNRSNDPINQDMLDQLEARLPGIVDKLQFILSMVLGISSSEIRWRVSEGAPVKYYLPPKVYQVIRRRKLYLEQED
jgi:nicotinate-nucleotide adenylyltransferase